MSIKCNKKARNARPVRGSLRTRRKQVIAVKTKDGKLTGRTVTADAPVKSPRAVQGGTPGRAKLGNVRKTIRRLTQRVRRIVRKKNLPVRTQARRTKRGQKRELVMLAARETRGRVRSWKSTRKYMKRLDREARAAKLAETAA